MVALASATAEEALQVRQTVAEAGKGPAPLDEQTQGLHPQGCCGPTAHRRQAASRTWLTDAWSAQRERPLFCGLCEHLACVLDFLLQQGPGQQQGQNGGFIGAGGLAAQLGQPEYLLHPFDDELYLPSSAIEGQHLLISPLAGRQRAEEQQPATQEEGLLFELTLLAFPPSGVPWLVLARRPLRAAKRP